MKILATVSAALVLGMPVLASGAPEPRDRPGVRSATLERGPDRGTSQRPSKFKQKSGPKTGKLPAADRGTASLVFVYYGESKFRTFFQETVRFKHAMEAYDRRILLKHDATKLDIAQKDEKLADIKDKPTRNNLFEYIKQLADEGYVIDLWIFSHGWPGGFLASTGNHGSKGAVRKADIHGLVGASGSTGYAVLPIRLVYQINCYGKFLNLAWRSAGAKAVIGSRYINFFPTQFGRFARLWHGGKSVESALQAADNGPSRSVVHAYILNHANENRRVVRMGNSAQVQKWCKPPYTVLGKKDCARDYFLTKWMVSHTEWRHGKSGRFNMYYSSQKRVTGPSGLRVSHQLSWGT